MHSQQLLPFFCNLLDIHFLIIDNLCDPENFQKITYPIVKFKKSLVNNGLNLEQFFFSKRKMKFGNWFVKIDVNNQMCLHL
jgi:hypothetical protein